MTSVLKFQVNSMTALQIAAIVLSYLLLTSLIPAVAGTRESAVSRGVVAAQACEIEIDDDLGLYEDCVGQAANRLRRQPQQLLGLHFQAWLVADLAARQGAGRSVIMRQDQHQALKRLLRKTGQSMTTLCSVKQLDCAEVQQRMLQKF
jgi:hypothetical protein